MPADRKRHQLGFWQADPLPTAAELRRFYAEKYYQECVSSTYAAHYSDEELRHMELKASVAAGVVARLAPRGRRLLDVGCGEGFLAAAFGRWGWEIAACDFSREGLERHNPQLLPRFEQGDIYDILARRAAAEDRFDFVNLANVLEHVPDPLALLHSLRCVLGPHGVLRIVVPNDFSDFQSLLLERGCTDETWFIPPEHLNYFTAPSLRATLDAVGFELSVLLAEFPIEVFLLDEHSNYWRDRSRGKAAHLARVAAESFLMRKDLDAYLAFGAASAGLGFGRDLVAYCRIPTSTEPRV